MSSPALQTRTRVTRIAQEAVDKARLTVVPRVRTRAPRVPFVTLVSLVLVGGIVGLLLFNTSMQQASFAASSLENEADVLAAREQTLRMELDELRNPQRVAEEAQKMGMVIPAAPVFLDLETGRTSGVRTPATRENALQLLPPAPVKPAILAPAPTVVEVPPTPTPSEATDATGQQTAEQQAKKNTQDRQARKNRNR
jgi:type II secretory pathway pseudopilin PulG